MNPLLQLLGLLIVFSPTILTIVVLIVVRRANRQIQEELRGIRADLAHRDAGQQPNS